MTPSVPESEAASRAWGLAGLILGCGALAVACGSKEAASSPSAASASPAPAQWFRGRMRQLPSWAEDLRRRLDPGADGWPSEVLGLTLERELPERIRRALAGDGRALDELLAQDFAGATALWPAELEVRLDDGDISVRRAAAIPSDLHTRGEIAALLAAWRAALRDAPAPRVEVWVDGLTLLDASLFEAHVCLRVSGEAGAGSIQQNLAWKTRWRGEATPGAAPPSLLRLDLESAEEVRTKVRPFAELTRQLLGKCEGFEQEFLRGSEDYHLHQDRLSGQPILGMHGLAVGDIDGDGLEDLYLCQPGGQPNRLLVHQPDGTVADRAHEAGLDALDNTGPALILDLDNDGDQDIAFAAGPRILIGWNDGGARFADHSILGVPDQAEITSMSAADPDGDGDLDLYACRYVLGGVSNGEPVPYWNAENGASDLFWRNQGDHRFVEVSKEVGLDVHTTRYGLALIWDDFDEDGQIDLYVVNDFGKNCLYRNQGGKFTDVAEEASAAHPAAGMGATCADVDHDGDLDVFASNMDSAAGARITSQERFMGSHPELRPAYLRHARGNTLLLGDGHGRFRDATAEAGVGKGGWAWGGMFFDMQNDTWPDLLVPNGFSTNRGLEDLSSYFWRVVVGSSPPDARASGQELATYVNAWDSLRHFAIFEGHTWNGRERDYAYVNLGGASFADASSALGLDFVDDGRLVAPMDWDDDGRIDLWLRNRTGPRLRFLRNVDPAPGHWLVLELAGTACNRDAIGARAFVDAGGVRLRQTVYAAQGYMSAPSRRLHFGLGPATRAEKIEVRWPGGGSATFENVAADARYRIVQGKAEIERIAPRGHAALAAMASDPVVVEPRDVERMVLFERLPARPIEIPSFQPAVRSVASFQGRPLLLWIGFADDPASRHVLEALAAQRKDLDATGAVLVALDAGEAAGDAGARALFKSCGVEAQAGRADKRFLQAVQVLLMELLGPFDRLAYPLTLLFDSGGQLTVVYAGVPDVRSVLVDTALTRELNPAESSTERLLRGRWAHSFPRNLEGLAQIFDLLGEPDLGRFYHGAARARAPK